MTPAPAPTGPSFWDLLSSAVIPGSAIVISVLLAVLLFVAERRASAMAKRQERQDRVLEGIIETLSFFVSVNPFAETWSGEFRKLRAQVTVLQTLPGRARLLGEWMAFEGDRGKRRLLAGMATLQAQRVADRPVTDEDLLAAMSRTHDWAAATINSIAGWMRDEVNDDKVHAAIAELKAAATTSP